MRPFRLELAEGVSRQQFNGNKLRLASLEVYKLKRFNDTIKTPWPINIIHAHFFFFFFYYYYYFLYIFCLAAFWKAATAICDFWTLEWNGNRIQRVLLWNPSRPSKDLQLHVLFETLSLLKNNFSKMLLIFFIRFFCTYFQLWSWRAQW
jgi:hypothetical protein